MIGRRRGRHRAGRFPQIVVTDLLEGHRWHLPRSGAPVTFRSPLSVQSIIGRAIGRPIAQTDVLLPGQSVTYSVGGAA